MLMEDDLFDDDGETQLTGTAYEPSEEIRAAIETFYALGEHSEAPAAHSPPEEMLDVSTPTTVGESTVRVEEKTVSTVRRAYSTGSTDTMEGESALVAANVLALSRDQGVPTNIYLDTPADELTGDEYVVAEVEWITPEDEGIQAHLESLDEDSFERRVATEWAEDAREQAREEHVEHEVDLDTIEAITLDRFGQ